MMRLMVVVVVVVMVMVVMVVVVVCESVGAFMTFADQVSQRVTAIRAATAQGKVRR